jgi:hypothetical protein
VLAIRILRKLGLFTCLSLATLLLPQHSFAALLDVQQKNDIVYFLFAAPNKIVRYDLNKEEFLSKIVLDNVPTAFHVNDSAIYTTYGNKLYKSELNGGSAIKVYQDEYTIFNITSIGNYLYYNNDNQRSNTISLNDYTLISTRYNHQNSEFTVNKASLTSRSIFSVSSSITPYKVTISDAGVLSGYTNSQFSYSAVRASKIYIHPNEDKVYTNAGLIYSSEDLSFRGSLTTSFNEMTFLENRPIVIRDNQLFMYSEKDLNDKSYTLDHTPSHIAATGQIITSFVTTNSLVTAHKTNINKLTKPSPSEPKDPNSSTYQAELITTDKNNIVFLLDNKSPTIHRRKATESEFASSWALTDMPSLMMYSENHQRLYLAYDSGKITYFDTSLINDAIETHYISFTHKILGLVAAGDYIYVNALRSDSDANSFSIDKQGIIQDHTYSSNITSDYIWSPLNESVFQMDTRYLKWTSLLSSNGDIDSTRGINYLDSSIPDYQPPLLISPNGQVLLTGSGQIIGAENQTALNNLDNPIKDATWINGNLISINKETNALQVWQEDYVLTTEYPIPKSKNIQLFNLNEKLIIVKQSNTRPVIIYTDLVTLPDSDDDEINDLDDNCEFISNPEQSDIDQDNIGDQCDDDSDNDLMPNSIERAAGLDELDASDALLDLDGDGFKNLFEFMFNTDMNDSESKPAIIEEMSEDFNDTIPLGFYSSDPENLSIIKNNNFSYLAIPTPNKIDLSSSIFYTGSFQQGLLSFKYGVLVSSYGYSLEVIVDGEIVKSTDIYYNTSEINISLEKNVHTIEFKITRNSNSYSQYNDSFFIDKISFGLDLDEDEILDSQDNCPTISNSYQHDSDNDGLGNECDNDPFDSDKDADGYGDYLDNCPDTYNPDQLNIDNDYYGDACDDSDDSPSDVDQDGIPDSYDNCINTANPDQEDFDYDQIGDTCDIDIDNDGVLNTLEDQFDFMSSYNSNDAYLDFDNDGASNQYEINNNSSPAQENTFAEIDLLDYYPVGDLDYFYISDYQFIRSSMKKTDTPGRFIISSSNGVELTIERRSSGIYLESFTSTSIYSDAAYIFENHLILPNSLKPGHTLTLNSIQTIAGSSDSAEYERSFYLKDVGERVWRGKVYPSITVIEDGAEKVYLKGIGQLTLNYMELDSVNFDFIEASNVVAPKKSSGGGSLAPFVFFLLSIMAYATRTRRK